MKLRFTQRAAADILAISGYIRARNPDAAQRVRDAILDAAQTLVRFPRLGRPQTTEGVRKLVTRWYSYVVYYVVDEAAGEIIILTVKHPARSQSDVADG